MGEKSPLRYTLNKRERLILNQNEFSYLSRSALNDYVGFFPQGFTLASGFQTSCTRLGGCRGIWCGPGALGAPREETGAPGKPLEGMEAMGEPQEGIGTAGGAPGGDQSHGGAPGGDGSHEGASGGDRRPRGLPGRDRRSPAAESCSGLGAVKEQRLLAGPAPRLGSRGRPPHAGSQGN